MLDAKKIKESLTKEQVIELVYELGAQKHIEQEEAIIFPTICHNFSSNEGSLKLYYYENRNLFFCYTGCDSSFDIYGLVLKVFELNDRVLPYGNTFYGALEYVAGFFNFKRTQEFRKRENYVVVRDKFKRKNTEVILKGYSPKVLDVFQKFYTPEWQAEGISIENMEKFNISHSFLENKVVIPHYDVHGRLVGIRGRDMNEHYVAKYMPISIENYMYSHQLSFNLYGLNMNKENIRKVKTAIIFEGEKSVQKAENILGTNYSVATCGSSINKFQVGLLVKYCQVSEIIIAFDKEYDRHVDKDGQEYFSKLYRLGEKYNKECQLSFIYDMAQLLEKKDSPVDRGKEVFDKLLAKRIFIR